MGFEQELRAYLEERDRDAPTDAAVRHIDEHELYRHLVDRLRTLEAVGTPSIIEDLFHDWQNKLSRFVRHLETLPRQLAPVDPPEAMAFARRTLDVALDCLDAEVPLLDRLQAQRAFAGFAVGRAQLEEYALENLLVRRGPSRSTTLTGLGRAFMRLRGKGAVRWLITCEVAQSTGRRDPWHAPASLLQNAFSGRVIKIGPVQGDEHAGYSDQTLDRLASLDVLIADTVLDVVLSYRLSDEMRDVVQAVLEPGPWHTAVRAVLDDERALVLTGAPSTATEATIEQTMLIVHEVRNALIPVRYDMEALRAFAAEHAQQERIDAAKQGITRVLDFVEAMAQMSELITEPVARYEIGALVDEAVGWVDASRRVVCVASAQAAHVLAPRVRFARAISNVVGNALQVTTAGQPVRVSIAHGAGVVRVVVDDGGPGIAIEHRARVFLEGVTMRPDGTGSGFGLAFAKRVVEGALHGKIWCEDSDLGGARFVIEVPEASPG